jgi:glycosyltransferase involved in cell wall biosynthesis
LAASDGKAQCKARVKPVTLPRGFAVIGKIIARRAGSGISGVLPAIREIILVTMNIGAILPHTLLYGGVQRYLELGNAFIHTGHSFTVYTPDGASPSWFSFAGTVSPLAKIKEKTIDVLFTSEESFLDELLSANARRRVFYVISKNKAVRLIARHKGLEIFANSTTTFQHILSATGKKAFQAYGGVNTNAYRPVQVKKDPAIFRILTYGRLSARMKGTTIVAKACERLHKKGYPIKLVLFDSPVDEKARQMIQSFKCRCPFEYILDQPVEKNAAMYCSSDVFVSAERKGGWANTAAEAMACGVPVIATKVGTRDFLINKKTGLVTGRNRFSIAGAIRRLIDDPALREKYAQAGSQLIMQFSWESLADTIIKHIQDHS